jgi:hypothetical protein
MLYTLSLFLLGCWMADGRLPRTSYFCFCCCRRFCASCDCELIAELMSEFIELTSLRTSGFAFSRSDQNGIKKIQPNVKRAAAAAHASASKTCALKPAMH